MALVSLTCNNLYINKSTISGTIDNITKNNKLHLQGREKGNLQNGSIKLSLKLTINNNLILRNGECSQFSLPILFRTLAHLHT